MTAKQEILKRLLEEKYISFEEMLILSQKDIEYIYYNSPSVYPNIPYFTTCTTTENPISIYGDTSTAHLYKK